MRICLEKLFVFVFLLTFSHPLIAPAVSYSTLQERREEKQTKGIKFKGEAVCLFHGGTGDVKQSIKVGDILFVYREESGQPTREVGKIKVLLHIGNDFLKGEVVDGEAQTGDRARKGSDATLIVPIEGRF
jgi:hypothetical protein